MNMLEKLNVAYLIKLKEEADEEKYKQKAMKLILKIQKAYDHACINGIYVYYSDYEERFSYAGFQLSFYPDFPKNKKEYKKFENDLLLNVEFNLNISIEQMFDMFSKYTEIEKTTNHDDEEIEKVELAITSYNNISIFRNKNKEYWCCKQQGSNGSWGSGSIDFDDYGIKCALNVLRANNKLDKNNG